MISILVSGLILLSLNRPDGVYATGDTVKVFANDVLVHEEVCHEGAYNPRFDYEDTCIGWVVNPSEYVQDFPCPKDFYSFWRKALRRLRKYPMNPIVKDVPARSWDSTKFVCKSIELACPDTLNVHGFFAMPRGAAPKSLPIVIYTRAAGVAGHWVRAHAEEAVERAGYGNGAISIDINPLGMLNDQPQAYYDSLEAGPLREYWKQCGPTPYEHFYRGMYERAVRALDYACSLPEWDGKVVMAYGQSQGGRQALALGGLDKRVTDVVAIIPGGCNRPSKPLYYDCSNLAPKIKGKVWVEIGLLDTTCPPREIYTAVNKFSDVQVITSPWRYHNEPDERYWKHWKESIYNARMDYINKVLSE